MEGNPPINNKDEIKGVIFEDEMPDRPGRNLRPKDHFKKRKAPKDTTTKQKFSKTEII